ncbi:MAG: hypothetical protein ACOYOR_02480 [Flavobacterium psychrophilum]
MKKLNLFVLLAALVSCQAISTLKDQKITLSTAKVSVDQSQNLWRIPVQIHQKIIPFVFDTGAMFSAINNAESICPKELECAINFGWVLGADHKKQPQKLVVLAASSPLFESENKVFAALKTAQNRCAKPENTLQGILGMDLFFHQEKPLVMSYSTGSLMLLDRVESTADLLKQGYQLLPSKFKGNAILVSAQVENKQVWFKLDSGFSGTSALPYAKKNHFQNHLKTVYVGSAFQTALGHTLGKEVFYSKMPVIMGSNSFPLQCVESSTLKVPVLGFKFMQGFDWIFDFKNKQLFAKRNGLPIPENYSNLPAYRAIAGDKLRIGLKAVNAKSFHLGDEIVAVNGVKVSDKNRCEFEELLNSTANWGQLELLVSSTK